MKMAKNEADYVSASALVSLVSRSTTSGTTAQPDDTHTQLPTFLPPPCC